MAIVGEELGALETLFSVVTVGWSLNYIIYPVLFYSNCTGTSSLMTHFREKEEKGP